MSTLPAWAEWAVAIGHIVGPVLVAIVAWTAFRTAQLARKEFAIARQPIVIITDLEIETVDKNVSLSGCLKEVVGIPTTVHSIRPQARRPWQDGCNWEKTATFEQLNRLLHRDAPPERYQFGTVNLEGIEEAAAASPDFLEVATFNIAYTYSVKGGPRYESNTSPSIVLAKGKYHLAQFSLAHSETVSGTQRSSGKATKPDVLRRIKTALSSPKRANR